MAKRRISILNFKGGTGKSSVVQNLGDTMARQGVRVLAIDGDRQSNTTVTMLGERKTPSISDVIARKATLAEAMREARPNFWVVPSDTDLDHSIGFLKEHYWAFDVLRKSLDQLPDIDVVLIDQAGAFTTVMQALLLASEEVLIPCELEPYSVQGLFDMFAKLEQELPDHSLANAGIIPYAVDMRPKMTHLYLDQLRQAFGDLVTDPVRTDKSVANAQSVKKTVYEYDPRCGVVKDFVALAERLLREPVEVS